MTRTASAKVVPLIVERWSPRAFDGSAVPQEDLDLIFEAAGLAASAYNYQPWRFVYAHKGDANFDAFLSALVPFNQSWAKEAGVLVFAVSDEFMRSDKGNNPNHSHSFDTGAAWASAALQAQALGYHTHGMTGVDFDKAAQVLNVPEGFRVEMAFVIGTQGDAAQLPEGLREREVISDRKPVSEIAFAGPFTA
ncbi:nitroreductase family protein [Novosphingobium sp. SL115]|uniref:nitroreductase family protein n=1 Tax=Novosphingobium sp. SL115 TaxID=2995150 RepID=UPI00227440FD|nr:nitroreductase family protein [Novosphingobium sp. SL115]MCY1672026.1 nitroreductase family protein [Novosphingobium sp. SL115]